MAKDTVRVCSKCGTQWRLPTRVARERAPSRMEMMGRKMEAAGSSMTIGSRQRAANQLRLSNAEAKKERVLASAQCPNCGSSKYKEFPDSWLGKKPAEKAADKGVKRGRKSGAIADPPEPAGGAKPGVVVPPPPSTAAQWLADPAGTHELRWWDGTGWTLHVSDGGATSDDPL